ncbi:MAG: hypothetical protein VB068_13370 [Petrimonas sp.]|nr:hypothetical protein [Petrimonas sp.]
MDSYEFELPRECVLMKKALLSSGKDIAIAKISPAITGRNTVLLMI